MNLWNVFKAGRVRRWHTHPEMVEHDDRNDAHSGRVARLAKALFPDDHFLVLAALEHDDGESGTADVANPIKNRMPEPFRKWWEDLEATALCRIWGQPAPWCDPARLRLCDKLDAVMWAAWKEPHLMREDGWKSDADEVLSLARKCGVLAPVSDAIDAAVLRARRSGGSGG